MKQFTTNWALYDPLTPKKKEIVIVDTEYQSEEIRHKIKLIKKAFRK
ncbi:MAG: hypothetical protein PVH73_02785 [Candidatus Bathyarchaeota archaeon]